ncbi:DUF4912 domain-containing protein [Cyanobium sp. Aljojuca 7D2]|uniref:DUF4912 domain-containing protein n=1 Tax=Cyanobium sp. Aljojuca 7D2 TaxID=2823698 RepID=UPI0020CE72EA|nr:DUF4912 domain-containing protein [Cyanobium sp. Aljojuca 7D2]MCP9891760.1 DUF4912 domain-containing protein [Cyanobium sp. Aljojuca 7D2]
MAGESLSVAELAKTSVLQLRELAQRLGLKSYAALSKSDLIASIAGASAPATEPSGDGHRTRPAAVARPETSTQVVFLPRDPQWAYVFWEISSADRQRAAAAGAGQLCLRVADVTGLPQGSSHPHALQELVVDAQGKEWYLPVPLSDREYRVELGYRLSGGGWLSLAHSAVARVPADEPSAVVADVFVPFSLDTLPVALPEPISSGGVEHERLYQRAIAGSARSRRIGSEVLHEHDFINDQSGLLNASGAGLWASGRNESGSGVVRQRSFWLVADAELIVYGATEPSASLFIGDEQVPLSADGTFRMHVPFRDGQQLYPIRAIAADGEQQRSIRLEFERRTPEARVNTAAEAVAEWF